MKKLKQEKKGNLENSRIGNKKETIIGQFE